MVKRIRGLALALAVFMIVGILSSCGNTTYVLTVGETKVTSGLYLSMLVNAYSEATSKFTEEQKKDLWKQKVEKKDLKTYVLDKAYESSVNYVTTEKKFEELKLKLSEADLSEIQQQTNYYWQYFEKAYNDNGVNRVSYEKTTVNSKKNELIFKKLYDVGGLKAVPEADITKYYKDNYLRYQDISIPIADENGTAVDAATKTTLEAAAKGYLDRLNKGENFNTVFDAEQLRANPTTPPSSSTSAATSQTDAEKAAAAETEKVKNVTVNHIESTSLETTTLDALKKLELNKPTILTDTKAIHVIIKLDPMERPADKDAKRPEVLSKLKGEDYKKEVTAWSKLLKVTKNNIAISKYSPKNVKSLYDYLQQ